MNSPKEISTGSYFNRLEKEAAKIKKRAKLKKVRRIVFALIFTFIFVGGIAIGIQQRSTFVENQYQQYMEQPQRDMLTTELMAYKDVYEIFVRDNLGNTTYQSLMGGLFCSKGDITVYPNIEGPNTLINIAGHESVLTSGFALDINIVDGMVYYRKPNTQRVTTYNPTTGTTTDLPLNNVGQFIVCDEDIFYIDLKSTALLCFNQKNSKVDTLTESGVTDFVVAGNNIIYLNDDHSLTNVDLASGDRSSIGNNITAFSYNGLLWLQNNSDVYRKEINSNVITKVDLGTQCNRLLGSNDSFIFFESVDGIYQYSIENSTSRKIGNGIFLGATNESLLIYDLQNDSYQIIDINL